MPDPAYKIRFAGKSQEIDRSGYCVYCYEIEYRHEPGDKTPAFKESLDEIGIDIPASIEVLEPKDFTTAIPDAESCGSSHGAGEVKPDVKKPHKIISREIKEATNKIKICFIAKCKNATDDLIEVSLERRGKDGWEIEHDPITTKPVVERLPGPAVAASFTGSSETVALLAEYEGHKAATILSQARFSRAAREVDPLKPLGAEG